MRVAAQDSPAAALRIPAQPGLAGSGIQIQYLQVAAPLLLRHCLVGRLSAIVNLSVFIQKISLPASLSLQLEPDILRLLACSCSAPRTSLDAVRQRGSEARLSGFVFAAAAAAAAAAGRRGRAATTMAPSPSASRWTRRRTKLCFWRCCAPTSLICAFSRQGTRRISLPYDTKCTHSGMQLLRT